RPWPARGGGSRAGPRLRPREGRACRDGVPAHRRRRSSADGSRDLRGGTVGPARAVGGRGRPRRWARSMAVTKARPFRFGLIGAGVAAEIHTAAMRTLPGVEVHAIADAAPERARALASRHGIPEVYETGDALAERAPVDAVAVLTPHHLHLPYVRAAARAGRHVLVEKAIAHTVAAADELIAECRAQGVTLAGIFQNRFTSAAHRLRDMVANGGLGRVFLASVTVNENRAPSYFLSSPWRGRKAEAGGGVLMIQAIHMID